jgi:hypothetical protein
MSFKPSILIPLLFLLKSGIAQTIVAKQQKLGESMVTIEEACFGICKRDVVFINVHDNEATSVSAAQSFFQERTGLIVRIVNNGERNIRFPMQSGTYSFDPNRVYSEEGRIATLKSLSATPTITVDAESEVAYFSYDILRTYIDSSRFIVALHNNTDSNLSILSYKKDQESMPNSGKVYVSPGMDPDDFILTTDTTIFNKLKERNINTVWENNSIIKDDGSLSVYAGLHGIPYINVEAQHDHFNEQLAMLEVVEDILEDFGITLKHRDKEPKTTAAEYRLAPDR